MTNEEKIEDVIELISRYGGFVSKYGGIDGVHHKQWLLDQTMVILLADKYNTWLERFNQHYDNRWDKGIAP